MQPPARMTFKFDGNLPREVRNDTAVPLAASSTALQQGERSEPPAASEAIGRNRPRGFTQRAAADAAGEERGYRLPGKGAQFAGGRKPPVTAGNVARGSASAGEPVGRDAWPSPYQDDVQALEDMIRSTEQAIPCVGPEGQAAGPGGRSRSQPASAAGDARETSGSDKPRRDADDRMRHERPARVAGFRKPYAAEVPAARREDIGAEMPIGAGRQTFPPEPGIYEPKAGLGTAEDLHGYRHSDPDLPDDVGERWTDEGGYERRYRGGPSWLRIFASVIGAIVTGAIFGYIVLALFTGEPLLPAGSGADSSSSALPAGAGVASPAAPGGSQTAKASAGVQGGGAAAAGGQTDKPAADARDANVPASVSYLLQYGVFQSEASMNEAVKELAAQGIAAAADATDGYRVYAGIATTKAEAEKLAAALTDAELYAKALDNEALALPQTAAAVSWATYLEESDNLIRLLGGNSAALLTQGGTQSPGKQAVADIKAALQRWNASAADMGSWSGSRADPAAALAGQIKASAEQMSAYASAPSPAKLNAVQTSAMKAALIARQLRAELGQDGD